VNPVAAGLVEALMKFQVAMQDHKNDSIVMSCASHRSSDGRHTRSARICSTWGTAAGTFCCLNM
jgi:hypothetical protein